MDTLESSTETGSRKTGLISIVVPCYNEELNVVECYERIKLVFDTLTGYSFELIFADDCSSDHTAFLLEKIAATDERVKLVVNSRNYGVYRNSFHAMRYATGDALIPMLPVDLQDPPEVIPELIAEWVRGFDVVAGTRRERNENFLMRNARGLYYRLVSRIGDYEIPQFAGEFQLLDKSVYHVLRDIDDYYPYTRGLIASLSSERALVPYVWQERARGKSKQNLWRLYDQGLNGIVSSSHAPFRALILIGVLLSVGATVFALTQIVAFLTLSRSTVPPGTATIIFVVVFFGGLNTLLIGALSEYVAAIHSQVRGRSRVQQRYSVNCEIDDHDA